MVGFALADGAGWECEEGGWVRGWGLTRSRNAAAEGATEGRAALPELPRDDPTPPADTTQAPPEAAAAEGTPPATATPDTGASAELTSPANAPADAPVEVNAAEDDTRSTDTLVEAKGGDDSTAPEKTEATAQAKGVSADTDEVPVGGSGAAGVVATGDVGASKKDSNDRVTEGVEDGAAKKKKEGKETEDEQKKGHRQSVCHDDDDNDSVATSFNDEDGALGGDGGAVAAAVGAARARMAWARTVAGDAEVLAGGGAGAGAAAGAGVDGGAGQGDNGDGAEGRGRGGGGGREAFRSAVQSAIVAHDPAVTRAERHTTRRAAKRSANNPSPACPLPPLSLLLPLHHHRCILLAPSRASSGSAACGGAPGAAPPTPTASRAASALCTRPCARAGDGSSPAGSGTATRTVRPRACTIPTNPVGPLHFTTWKDTQVPWIKGRLESAVRVKRGFERFL